MAIFLCYFILFAIPLAWPQASYLLTKDMAYSWNDQARIATVESLVERHTFKIEYSKYGLFTGDKIMKGSSFYATKPPVLSFIGGLVYLPLHAVWPLLHDGVQLSSWDHEEIIYPFVTLFTIGISSALMLLFLYKALLMLDIEERFRWWIVLAVGFGSLIFTYTTVFNNHAFAAAWLFIGFFFILRMYLANRRAIPGTSTPAPIRPRKLDSFLGGVFISLAGVSDLSGAIPFLPLVFLLLLLTRRLRFYSLLFLLGSLVWLIPHFILNWKITGDPLTPVYLLRSAYLTTIPGYFGEVFNQSEVHWYSAKRWVYIFNTLIGQRGAFLYTPALLFGWWGILTAIRRDTFGLRPLAIVSLLGIGASWIYICFWPANWGGTSYGLRYAVTATPLLIFFAAALFDGVKQISLRHQIFRESAFVGGVIAFIGAVYPWGAAGFLPQTNFSLFENLEYIGIDMLDWVLRAMS